MTWCKRKKIQVEMETSFGEVDASIQRLESGLSVLNEIKELSSEDKDEDIKAND